MAEETITLVGTIFRNLNSLGIFKKAAGMIFPLLLCGLVFLIIYLSYIPGTILSGWDTLHPEFNFPLNFQRLIFGVFREEQGLGAVAAHSHMSDLPRVVLLYVLSFFVKLENLRFLFIASNLLVGVLGVYFFLDSYIFKNFQNSKIYSFFGGLYYLFNLGTIQHFFVPFEMFTVQYAFLPWLYLTAAKFIEEGKRKYLLAFAIITLLATPMAFASTLWIAYFLTFSLFLIFFVKKYLKRVLVIFFITLFINSFWLLPNGYFILSGNAANVPNARINKIFSEEAFAFNKSYGNFRDTLILKNFLFDWPVYSGDDRFEYLLSDWRQHLKKSWVVILGYANALIVVLGILGTLTLKNKKVNALLLPGMLALIFIINLNPPFEGLFSIVRENFSLFKEALRFPFTKFSIILMFVFSIFFAYGNYLILETVKRLLNLFGFMKQAREKLAYFYIIPVMIITILFCWPVFKTGIISKYMQIKIPDEYQELFAYMDTQDQGRVAILPVHTFWGWVYYDWGFQGAQFLSFGIKQPILDRDYDRWNIGNENYYREIAHAVYSQDLRLLENTLEKYKVKFLIFDPSIIAPGVNQDKKIVYKEEIMAMLNASRQISFKKKFGNIQVYKYQGRSKDVGLDIFAVNSFINVKTNQGPVYQDWIFNDYGDYVLSKDLNNSSSVNYYPFHSLSDNQGLVNNDLLFFEGDEFLLKLTNLPRAAKLSLNNYLQEESAIPMKVYTKRIGQQATIRFVPNIEIVSGLGEGLEYRIDVGSEDSIIINIDNNQTEEIKLEESKVFLYKSTIFLNSRAFNNLAIYKPGGNPDSESLRYEDIISYLGLCSEPRTDQLTGISYLKDSFKLKAKNADNCVQIRVKNLIDDTEVGSYKSLMQIKFGAESKTGNSGHFCINDLVLGRCVKEKRYLQEGNLTEYFPIDLYSKDGLALKFILNGVGSNEVGEIEYKHLSAVVLEPFEQISISPDDIKGIFSNLDIILNKGELLRLNNINERAEGFKILEESKGSSSCSNILPADYRKDVNRELGYIEYSSKEGSSCDYFAFPNLVHNSGYLVVSETQNLSGLPIRVCVANNFSKRCDIYSALPSNKEFKKQVLMVPPIFDGGSGYNLHIDNYSVGSVRSTNRIKEIKIIPFPYQWISRMQFVDKEVIKQTADLEVVSKKLFPGFYYLKIKNNSDRQGLVQLNRSEDLGWTIAGFNKVRVNSWANGWLVPAKFNGSKILVYIPQLLELGPLIIIFAGSIYLLVPRVIRISRLLIESFLIFISIKSPGKGIFNLFIHSIKTMFLSIFFR